MRFGFGERYWWEFPIHKATLKGHKLEIAEDDLLVRSGSTSPLIQDLVWKLNAEFERLSRLLPEPPPGYRWEMEHQRSENEISNTIYFRVVATLKEIE